MSAWGCVTICYVWQSVQTVHSVHRPLPPVSHLALTNLNCSRECRVFGSAAVCIVRILAVADRGEQISGHTADIEPDTCTGFSYHGYLNIIYPHLLEKSNSNRVGIFHYLTQRIWQFIFSFLCPNSLQLYERKIRLFAFHVSAKLKSLCVACQC